MRVVEVFTGVCAGFALIAYGCAGDHDRLKKEDPVGGEGGMGGMGGATTTSTTGGGGSGGIQEPPGPPQLTLVNGTVDEDAIRLCLVPYPDGPASEAPWPEGDRLPYARGEVVPIEDVVPPGVDVEIILVAGPLAASDGLDCAELEGEPPPGVLLRSVGIFPESVFTTEKSILIATAGCVGGRDHEHENQELICGKGYASDNPTATVVAGFMSRLTDSSKIPLQFVQASLGVSDVQLRVKPGNGSTAQQIVNTWTFGAIAPYPPYLSLGLSELGNVGQTTIELYTTGSTSPLSSTVWGQAFANSELEEGDVKNGVGLAFVAVGPVPSFDAGPWWNGFTYSVVLADPE